MNSEIKKKWVEALRSGQYEQGRGYLKSQAGDTVRYCCLGVLCEVQGVPSAPRPQEQHVIPGVFRFAFDQDAECEFSLGFHFRQTVGLNYVDEDYLSRLNDIEHKTFSEIADYIEANL